jgi:hypothetical protein
MVISSSVSGRYIVWSLESVLKPSHNYVDTTVGINVILKLINMMQMPYFADKLYLCVM